MTTLAPGMKLEEVEKIHILATYNFHHKNKTATASALGIAIRTLDAKLEKYDADRREEERRIVESRREADYQLARARGITIEGRVGLEPIIEPTEKHAVPVPEQKEVQELLPSASSTGGARRGRPPLQKSYG